MKYLKKYNESFDIKYHNNIDENVINDFERLNKKLEFDEEWNRMVDTEFYDWGVSNFYDYLNDAGIDQGEYIVNRGKEMVGEETNEEWTWFDNERVEFWKELNKEERKSFLSHEFEMSPEDVDDIYSDNIKELPQEMKDYFAMKDED